MFEKLLSEFVWSTIGHPNQVYKKLKELIETNAIGKIKFAQVSWPKTFAFLILRPLVDVLS